MRAYVHCIAALSLRVAWALLGPVLVFAQGQVRYQSSPISLDFTAKTADRQWAVDAEITGTVTREGASLRVLVKDCSLFRPDRFTDAENLVAIVAEISRQRPGDTWEFLRRSEQYPVNHSLAPNELLDLGPFEFTIPLEDFTMERGDWLTFQIYNTTMRNGRKGGAFVPVHARIQWPDSFVSVKKPVSSGTAPFRAYSEPAMEHVAGEIRGAITPTTDGLTLNIDWLDLFSSDQYPDAGRRVATIQAVIARTIEYGRTSIERTGGSYTLDQILQPGSKLVWQPFALDLSLINYAKHPSDRINLRVTSVTSEGQRETTSLYVPYELPVGYNPPPVSQATGEVAPSFPTPPALADPMPISLNLREAIRTRDLVGAADLASKLDVAVHEQLNAWLIRDAAERVDEVLSWLPIDTESFLVYQQPAVIRGDSFEPQQDRPVFENTVDRLAALDEGKYYRALAGRTIRFSIAAGRNIREQAGLSWSISARDVVYFYFLDAPVDLPGAHESIRGLPVWRGVAKIDSGEPFRPHVERTKREDENWIALPRPDLMILTNNRQLLNDVLDRILDGSQTRAFAPSLPEWKQVDRQASFWGLRHYTDSSKPKLGQRGFGLADLPRPDGRATGVVVQFYAADDRLEVRYLSAGQLASRGPADSIYSQFKVDQPQTAVWRLVSNIRERGAWPLQLALRMLGFGIYQ